MKIRVTVERRETPVSAPRMDVFALDVDETANIISVLLEIRKNPVTVDGRRVAPVSYECSCLEEVCGACSMNINGTARQACSALVKEIGTDIRLAPLSKFPIVRDLVVDRKKIFAGLRRIKAWIPIDGTHGLGPGPKVSEKTQRIGYRISRCMSCGVCMESCPQVNDRSNFIGPAVMAQALLFNMHPTGAMIRDDRLEKLMDEGGIGECGNAQNCVKACPKQVPLTYSIGRLNRDTLIYSIRKLLDS